MTMGTPDAKIAALYRALDWLEAHPERAITGCMATTKHGYRCRPLDPNAACFCFLGRLIVEAGPEERLTTSMSITRYLLPLGMDASDLSFINDKTMHRKTRFAKLRHYIDSHIGVPA